MLDKLKLSKYNKIKLNKGENKNITYIKNKSKLKINSYHFGL
jgi:hypothetical protein